MNRILTTCVVVTLVVAGGALAGCTSGSHGKTVDVSLIDFKVIPKTTSIGSGAVTFDIHNNGGFVHELIVDRYPDAAALPTKPDGEVNENAIPSARHLGEVKNITPGSSKELTVTLPPGKYVLFCNRVDGTTVHFKQGMHADLTVTASG